MRVAALPPLLLLACATPELGSEAQALEAPPEVGDWLEAAELPLVSVEAGHGYADLRGFGDAVGDARVVALGEATHGSREFFQLKHRLLEYLVERRGFDTFAFEAGVPEALDVDAYVRGVGPYADGGRVIAGLGYWPWMTEEVVDIVEWMRDYNRTHGRQLRFAGVDMQVPDRAVREVLAYLRRVDPPRAAAYAASLHMATSRYDFFTLDPDGFDALRVELEALLAELDANHARYRQRSSEREWRLQRHLAEVALQAVVMTYADFTGDEWEGSNVRDAAMADNVEWLLGPGGAHKIVLWAHNDHVARSFWEPAFINLGQHLDARLGDDLHVVGMSFDDGAFQALGANLRLAEFTVASGGPETLDGTMAAHLGPQAIVPLDAIPAGPVADYLAAPPLKRDITAGYLEDLAELYFRPIAIADFYDSIGWVATTTRARPLTYARDQITPQPTLPAATNLGFEDGTTGWFEPAANEVSGYAAFASALAPYAGAGSALVTRTPTRTYGRNYGELRQRISAVPYRGKRVRVRAAIRSLTGDGGRVHLWARSGIAYDGMHDRPIGTSPWTVHELVLNVSPTAGNLQFGVVVVGDALAWIDDVQLVVDP